MEVVLFWEGEEKKLLSGNFFYRAVKERDSLAAF